MSFMVVNEMSKQYDLNIMLYFEGEVTSCDCLTSENKELIERVIKSKEFVGKSGEKIEINIVEGDRLLNLLYLGVGKKEDYSEDVLRKVLFKALKGIKGSVLITAQEEKMLHLDAIAEVSVYTNYTFDRHKSDKREDSVEIEVYSPTTSSGGCEGLVLGEAVSITKDLINEPANVIYPETLANIAIEYGKKYGFEVEVMEEEAIEKLGMESYLSVARAAEKRPRLIVMRHLGNPEDKDNIVGVIGKGLTYDTGGLSLKPTDGMKTMKCDMGGAATVIGAMTAVARMNLKKNVIGVIAACENSIGGNAYRPGDIIGSMNGKTIEVTNTDAEGRLTLIDAITYTIRNEKATEIVDVATLTGGVMVALGLEATGAFTNTDSMYENIEKSSREFGENIWRLPLFDEYKEMLKSPVADLVNSAGRWASAATAAKFLEEFVEGTPWLHLDIAGSSFSTKEKEYYSKGATGRVVRTLYSYLKK